MKINYVWKYCVWYLRYRRLPELASSNVHIADISRVNEVIKKFISDGPGKLQVISDFDHTLSSHTYNNKSCPSCHSILDNSLLLPEDFRVKAAELRNIYYPIEIDPNLGIEQKTPKMVEWWTEAHKNLERLRISRDSLKKMVAESSARLRDGCDILFQNLEQHNVPLLIFSAGLGDIIREILEQKSKVYSNMKIVSNFMKFDEQNLMSGFEGNIIHTFNKNENAVHKSEYFEQLKARSNIILMGDSLGDLRMADGVEENSVQLKIGYLNEKVEESLETYKKSYDIVLTKTENMDLANTIISKISK